MTNDGGKRASEESGWCLLMSRSVGCVLCPLFIVYVSLVFDCVDCVSLPLNWLLRSLVDVIARNFFFFPSVPFPFCQTLVAFNDPLL